MDSQGVWQERFPFFAQRPVVVEPVEAHLSTDAGLLPIRQLTRSRVYGILAGYEDQNDHDALRKDAVFKLIAGRSPEDKDLASQPTLSRFENSIGPRSMALQRRPSAYSMAAGKRLA